MLARTVASMNLEKICVEGVEEIRCMAIMKRDSV